MLHDTVPWSELGVEPHWLGQETVECVAALEPGYYSDSGGQELQRLLDGAQSRSETALIMSVLGYAEDPDPVRSALGRADDSRSLPGFRGDICARRLPAGSRPRLVPDLGPAEHDLGTRLLNRPADAPWWTITAQATFLESGSPGGIRVIPASGLLEPILVDAVGEPVVAVWVSAELNLRWYFVPDAIGWKTLVDWLVQQAIPRYVPDAPRRFRAAGFVDPAWLTTRERSAHEAVTAMTARHAEERARLEAELAAAQQAANMVRDGLLYGSGTELERAVEQVLTEAGLSPLDLDTTGKGTWSADLLVTASGQRRLVEVKSARGAAGESLVGDLRKHLDTWAVQCPDKPVTGGTLIVNHQLRLDPGERSRYVYSRPEFVQALTVPVISTIDLLRWWKDCDWAAITQAVLGGPPAPSDEEATVASPAAARQRVGRWQWWRRRIGGQV